MLWDGTGGSLFLCDRLDDRKGEIEKVSVAGAMADMTFTCVIYF